MQFISSHDNTWHTVGGEDGPQPHPKPVDHALLTLEQWHAVRDTWPAGLATGVILANTAEVEELAADLPRLALVVLQFPKWTDGRAYSQAHVLRARLRYSGEVRASGDVLVDMVPLLARTGFSQVRLRHDQNEESARRTLTHIPSHYQGDATQARPLFARTAA
ncbi:DUF934 domain-containing protein [Ideonella livida]|uniref:DUF934 domain-containing protein n=1 Tax=Ideonella livida TaxID=2707176 RepID=A0A7C9PIS1_9BURK|nr:DUF934 domain-containing protein [Ideonella livida]NDY92192.1 DUF934 domain-containing protein [Ideonella livida]